MLPTIETKESFPPNPVVLMREFIVTSGAVSTISFTGLSINRDREYRLYIDTFIVNNSGGIVGILYDGISALSGVGIGIEVTNAGVVAAIPRPLNSGTFFSSVTDISLNHNDPITQTRHFIMSKVSGVIVAVIGDAFININSGAVPNITDISGITIGMNSGQVSFGSGSIFRLYGTNPI